MLKCLLSRKTPLRLANKRPDELFGQIGDLSPLLSFKFILTFDNCTQYLLVVLTVEGWVAAQQYI